ncbi:hypothetical protein L6164_029317 [Bauhinia variegata]|uniref:Uncharacterized protein n=1 Tax=Bauhinia variegata TaxID=167791 RepID=A0ACB9LA70_BAUVA|nr:hypothetical protein L6164_029317 [Bauhinia variegata]
MANVSVAAEWQLLYNQYYRKPEIYPMKRKHIDLSRNKLRIFNSAGVQISETVWRHPGGRLIGMVWTDDQTLICVVQEDSGIEELLHCIAVIEPQYTISGNVEVLLGVSDASVLVVEEDGVQQLGVGLLRGPLQKMVVSGPIYT